jgi:hypothetical protein
VVAFSYGLLSCTPFFWLLEIVGAAAALDQKSCELDLAHYLLWKIWDTTKTTFRMHWVFCPSCEMKNT